jgi:hypothetical protein
MYTALSVALENQQVDASLCMIHNQIHITVRQFILIAFTNKPVGP